MKRLMNSALLKANIYKAHDCNDMLCYYSVVMHHNVTLYSKNLLLDLRCVNVTKKK